MGRGSDHKPAVGTEDRLRATEPKNQDKNVSRCSHRFLRSTLDDRCERAQQGFTFYVGFQGRMVKNNSERGTFSVITCEDRVGF